MRRSAVSNEPQSRHSEQVNASGQSAEAENAVDGNEHSSEQAGFWHSISLALSNVHVNRRHAELTSARPAQE